MLTIEASTRAESPARLLKPASVMRRLRPLKLEAVLQGLLDWDYLRQAVQLAQLVAPQELEGIDHNGFPAWWELMREIIGAVETEGWFDIDRSQLDADWQYMMEDPDSGRHHFAQWLTCIPVELYGFSDYDDDWPEQYPPMALLAGLLGERDISQEHVLKLIEEYDITTDFGEITCSQLRDRLNTADFSGYEPPLCWLPDIARIACGRTGNTLLDLSSYMEEEPLGWTWAEDLELAKQTYAAAAPLVERMREFLTWCDGPDQMQEMVEALVGPLAKRKRRRRKRPTLVDMLTPGVER